MRNDIKKPLLSSTLVGGDNKGLQSANADQHRDRITRFGILKHRSKQQENFLWTLAKFKKTIQMTYQVKRPLRHLNLLRS